MLRSILWLLKQSSFYRMIHVDNIVLKALIVQQFCRHDHCMTDFSSSKFRSILTLVACEKSRQSKCFHTQWKLLNCTEDLMIHRQYTLLICCLLGNGQVLTYISSSALQVNDTVTRTNNTNNNVYKRKKM